MNYHVMISISYPGWAGRVKVLRLDLKEPETFARSFWMRGIDIIRDAMLHAEMLAVN